MQDLTAVLRRAGQLCASLVSDAELKRVLDQAGFNARNWAKLSHAITTGSVQQLTALLDAVEEAAANAGLDGVTYPTREFRPLPPGLPGVRTISGWRCPHAHRCGRAHPAADQRDAPRCAVTGDTLSWFSVDSG
jgi:hypothetical protein